MLLLKFFILIFWIIVASSSIGDSTTFKFRQKLDHFEQYKDLRDFTFQQKFVINKTNWAGADVGAPIFVLLGGFGDLLYNPNTYGILSLSADKYKAMLVHIEHRFHGDSVPLNSIELAKADERIMNCLSIEQSLQDFAVIIKSLKVNLSVHNSPVIAVGMGYAGALAAWFRTIYPDIAIGALASSAPIKYYGTITPREGYCSIVSDNYKDTDPLCYNLIRNSWKHIDAIALRPNGLAQLSSIFGTCRPLQSSNELKNWLAQLYSCVAQYDGPNRKEVRNVCTVIGVDKKSLKSFASMLKIELNAGECFDSVKNSLIEVFSPYEPQSNETTGWAWLRCNGLIYPVGCANNNTMLPYKPFSMTEFEQSCQERFGVFPHPRSPINLLGSHNMEEYFVKFGGNIIFSNGLRDPFYTGAILKNLSESIISITAPEGAFAWEMSATNYDDPEWLIEDRVKILTIFTRWMNHYHHISNGSDRRACNWLTYILLESLLVFYICI